MRRFFEMATSGERTYISVYDSIDKYKCQYQREEPLPSFIDELLSLAGTLMLLTDDFR